MPDDTTGHLERLRDDIRGEIKQRIEQRDKFSVQLTIAVAAIYALAFQQGIPRLLLIAPIASLFFTVLILYSYSIHTVLAEYLRTAIEPELARKQGHDPALEWETWYEHARHRPGIRRYFFLWAHWTIMALSWLLAFLYPRGGSENDGSAGSSMSAGALWGDVFLMFSVLAGTLYVTLRFGPSQAEWREFIEAAKSWISRVFQRKGDGNA